MDRGQLFREESTSSPAAAAKIARQSPDVLRRLLLLWLSLAGRKRRFPSNPAAAYEELDWRGQKTGMWLAGYRSLPALYTTGLVWYEGVDTNGPWLRI